MRGREDSHPTLVTPTLESAECADLLREDRHASSNRRWNARACVSASLTPAAASDGDHLVKSDDVRSYLSLAALSIVAMPAEKSSLKSVHLLSTACSKQPRTCLPVDRCETAHCRGISAKPMLTKCLTAFLTTVSGSLVFRHRACSRPRRRRAGASRRCPPHPPLVPGVGHAQWLVRIDPVPCSQRPLRSRSIQRFTRSCARVRSSGVACSQAAAY
jgi:hypothetical protein